ncbi:MAG TPA: aspartate aminotransferase family protein [Planctomycetaceae bacterium]|nr:aspartate aminotransferase family protein [Planctomycetaceae bacterium]
MHASKTVRQRSTALSKQLLERGRRAIAGGDSSTMRVLPYHLPLVAAFGRGSRIWDEDHNEYVDLNMAYGPLLFGHCPPHVIEAVTEQIGRRGSQLGFPTEITIRVAEKIQQLFPSMELMRFANSGTEADVSATRLARVYTGRPKIIQFEGHYHGWSDTLFNRYHALLDELPIGPYGPALPGTAGLNGAPHENLLVRWNDIDALRQCLEDHPGQIAGVIMEPVMGNSGVIPPRAGYLESVRKATTEHGALLIFDEVITGLRVAPGGAQERYGVRPDITVISKALGGGYPVAAFGASREIMQLVVDGTMFHGGVYSGNAIVMAAAEAVLDEVLANGTAIYQHFEEVTDQLARGIDTILDGAGIPHLMHQVGPMLSFFLTDGDVDAIHEYRDVRRHCDFAKYIRMQHSMQKAGAYYHPNQFEPMFLSAAHTSDDVGLVLERFEQTVSSFEA